MTRLFLMTAAATLVATAAGAAEPSYGRITRTIEVSHADLDLRTEQGARTMLQRLSAAASHACGEVPSGVDTARRMLSRRACRSASVTAAVATLGSAKVSEVYSGNRRIAAKLAHR